MAAFANTPIGTQLFKQSKVLLSALVLTFIIELAALGPIIYMLNTYDRVVSSRSLVTLLSLTAVLVLVYLFAGILEWIRSQILVRLSLKLDWELAPDVFDAAYRQQIRSKDVNIHQLLGDLISFKQFVSSGPALALMELPMALIAVLVGLLMHPVLAVFTAAAIVILLLTTYLQQKLTSSTLMDANNQYALSNRKAMMLLRNVETSYAMGMESVARKHWYEEHKKHLELQSTASELAGGVGGFIGLLNKLLPSFALGLGAYLAINDLITASMVFAASMLINKAIAPIQKILGNWKSIIEARQAYARLNELLQDYRAKAKSMALPAPKGHFVVKGLSIKPGASKDPVLEGLNFEVQPGTVLAVVGPMGSGKSTLAKAMVGIWAPSEGSVRLDGVEISQWDRDEVGPHIGFVAQESGFFDGSVAQNIARLGDVNPELVVQAATRVGMHEIILKMPMGYNTPIGEGSPYVLSGGQKQRLSIARAIYNSPKVLVLDEPNSALDDEGEKILARLIDEFKKMGHTIVAVTHRPALVGLADQLLVLQAGRMVAMGPPHEVVKKFQQQNAQSNAGLAQGANAPPDSRKPGGVLSQGNAS